MIARTSAPERVAGRTLARRTFAFLALLPPERALPLHCEGRPAVRVLPAAEYGAYTPASQAAFWGNPWKLTPQSDRYGYRLAGLDEPAAERQRAYGLIALGLGGAAALSWLFSGTAGSVLAPFFVVAIGAALVLLTALTLRVRTNNDEFDPGIPKWAVVSTYIFMMFLGGSNRLVASGILPGNYDAFYLVLLYPLVGSLLMMALLQLRANRMNKEQQEAKIRAQSAPAAGPPASFRRWRTFRCTTRRHRRVPSRSKSNRRRGPPGRRPRRALPA